MPQPFPAGETWVWQLVTYGILTTCVLVMIGCALAFIRAIWGDRRDPGWVHPTGVEPNDDWRQAVSDEKAREHVRKVMGKPQ